MEALQGVLTEVRNSEEPSDDQVTKIKEAISQLNDLLPKPKVSRSSVRAAAHDIDIWDMESRQ
jgi:hypothetical protein